MWEESYMFKTYILHVSVANILNRLPAANSHLNWRHQFLEPNFDGTPATIFKVTYYF